MWWGESSSRGWRRAKMAASRRVNCWARTKGEWSRRVPCVRWCCAFVRRVSIWSRWAWIMLRSSRVLRREARKVGPVLPCWACRASRRSWARARRRCVSCLAAMSGLVGMMGSPMPCPSNACGNGDVCGGSGCVWVGCVACVSMAGASIAGGGPVFCCFNSDSTSSARVRHNWQSRNNFSACSSAMATVADWPTCCCPYASSTGNVP